MTQLKVGDRGRASWRTTTASFIINSLYYSVSFTWRQKKVFIEEFLVFFLSSCGGSFFRLFVCFSTNRCIWWALHQEGATIMPVVSKLCNWFQMGRWVYLEEIVREDECSREFLAWKTALLRRRVPVGKKYEAWPWILVGNAENASWTNAVSPIAGATKCVFYKKA